jgi:viroplasmin and RNaseH domain-containing protein
MKKSHYVVWQGKQTGVFDSWAQVAPLVTGVKGARFKGFHSKEVADQAFELPWQDFIDTNNRPKCVEIPIECKDASTTMTNAVETEEFEFQNSSEPPW